jgi:NADPH:quinone reductase-like Zn-dependent oxidoreductase
MSTQKVFRLPAKGAGYNAITEEAEAIPKAHSHEVVVKIHATTLNYRDLAIANGKYPYPVKENVIPLSDCAGTIAAAGPAVEGFEKDDWVIANFDITHHFGPQKDWNNGLGGPIDGVARQYVTLPAASVVKIPKTTTLSWPQLAALVCTGTTAWNALYGNTPLRPGQTVLFLGTGGLSMTGLIIAKAAGAITIITSSSDGKLKKAKVEYGADHIINYKKTPKWAAEVNKITENRGVDLVFENGGSGTIAQSIECVKQGGQIAVMGSLSRADEMPDVATLVIGKGCVVRGVNVGAKQLTEDMVAFVCSKNLAVPIEKIFKFEKSQLIEAYRELEKADHVGKIAIEIASAA